MIQKRVYLNTCLSFHYMFNDENLNDVIRVACLIRRQCNACVSHDNEKRLWYSILDMWLLRNVIENLIFLPRLENDSLRVTFDKIKSWVMHCPDDIPILFKRDTCLCDQFPYFDVKYLIPSSMRQSLLCKLLGVIWGIHQERIGKW